MSDYREDAFRYMMAGFAARQRDLALELTIIAWRGGVIDARPRFAARRRAVLLARAFRNPAALPPQGAA